MGSFVADGERKAGSAPRCILTLPRPEQMRVLAAAILLVVPAALAARPQCAQVLAESLSGNYNETIAHAVHSMTVRGLRLFHPRATEDNKVSSRDVVPCARLPQCGRRGF